MKKKKGLIILLSVLAVCVVGYVVSRIIDWPIDYDNASGNVAKSARFSRQTAGDGDSNMEELLMNDENYRNNIVAAYMVMKTRSDQFNALVSASDDVAGNISEFSAVLKDMKDAQPMINNVCTSLEAAGADLDAVLSGESVKDVAQNTNNAALAYNLLQKQSNLANRFIDTADAYLKNNSGSDRLKFIRDQWLEYLQMNAFLNKDEKTAAELDKKGYLLSAEKSVATLNEFPPQFTMSFVTNTTSELILGFDSPVSLYFGDNAQIITVSDQNKLLGDQNKLLGDQDKLLGDQNKLLGDQDKLLGDQNKLLGDQVLLLGDQIIILGDQNKLLGDQNKLLGDQNKLLGDQNKLLGDQDKLLGDQDKLLGDQNKLLGDQDKLLGDQNKLIGDQNKLLGDKFTVGDAIKVMNYSIPFTQLHDEAAITVVNSEPHVNDGQIITLGEHVGTIINALASEQSVGQLNWWFY